MNSTTTPPRGACSCGTSSHPLTGSPANPENVTSNTLAYLIAVLTGVNSGARAAARAAASCSDQNGSKSAGSATSGTYRRSSASGRSVSMGRSVTGRLVRRQQRHDRIEDPVVTGQPARPGQGYREHRPDVRARRADPQLCLARVDLAAAGPAGVG